MVFVRRCRHLAAAVAVVTALAGCGGGGGLHFLTRATHDRADDISGPQIHFVYAVPAGRGELDHHRDVDGTLPNSIFLVASWFDQQSGIPSLRIDTYRHDPDITFLRLPRSNEKYEAAGPETLAADLARRGLNGRKKLYAVYYDGTLPAAEVCGLGNSGRHPFAIAFIAQDCFSNDDFRSAGFGSYNTLVFVMAHEIVHELGFVPECAPNATHDGHVSDSGRDLMAPELNGRVPKLDVGNDDYFRAHIAGCRDLSASPYVHMGRRLLIQPG